MFGNYYFVYVCVDEWIVQIYKNFANRRIFYNFSYYWVGIWMLLAVELCCWSPLLEAVRRGFANEKAIGRTSLGKCFQL
jgi:hypothetical protein